MAPPGELDRARSPTGATRNSSTSYARPPRAGEWRVVGMMWDSVFGSPKESVEVEPAKVLHTREVAGSIPAAPTS